MTKNKENRIYPENVMTLTEKELANFDEVVEKAQKMISMRDVMPGDIIRLLYDDLREQLGVENMLSIGISKDRKTFYIFLYPLKPDDPHEDGGYCEDTGVPYVFPKEPDSA